MCFYHVQILEEPFKIGNRVSLQDRFVARIRVSSRTMRTVASISFRVKPIANQEFELRAQCNLERLYSLVRTIMARLIADKELGACQPSARPRDGSLLHLRGTSLLPT
jgi:hypothetical protein